MLSDRRILSAHGDASNELEHLPLGEPILERLMQDNLANGPSPPRDSIRFALARVFTQRAFNFLFFHEFTHIASGHVDWQNAKHGSPCLAELGWSATSDKDMIERQAIETEADIGAASACADLSWQAAENNSHATPVLQSHDEHLFGYLFSAFSFMRCFGDESFTGKDIYGSSHPPFRIRVKDFWLGMQTYAQKMHGHSFKQFVPVMWNAAGATEQAFHFLTGEPMAQRERYTEATESAGTDHRERLKACWNGGLQQELAKYAHGPQLEFT